MNVKPDHRAAGSFIDINTLYIQRVNGKNVAMGFAFRWRCAIVSGFTKIGTRLQNAVWQLLPDQSQTLAVIRGYQRVN